MTYQGFVKKDSLKDDGFLNFAISTKEEAGKIITPGFKSEPYADSKYPNLKGDKGYKKVGAP